MITSRRSSSPVMMLWMVLRVCVISVSTGVLRMGKKRIKCSGGGNTLMSWMRSSSVWLVLSTVAYQASLLGTLDLLVIGRSSKKSGIKKPPGLQAGGCFENLVRFTRAPLVRRRPGT